MKYILLLVLSSLQVLHGQSSKDYLKTSPYITKETPNWAIEMYKEHPNVLKVEKLYEAYHAERLFEKTIHTQNYKHWRRQVEPFLNATGQLTIPDAKEIAEQHAQILAKKRNKSRSATTWTPMGPFETYNLDQGQMPVSWQANVYTLDQSITNANTVYVGTESGGIFKSIDKGMNWFMISDQTLIGTVRSIKIDPSDENIVYAGDGANIYKTINGGQTWSTIYTENSLGINDFSINREDPAIVLAASNRGLLRSTDGGSSWNTLYTETVYDIENKYTAANEVFILMANSSEIRTEFWKSTDYGATFELKDNGWYTSNNPDRSNSGGRMTITPADPDRIYTILIGNSKPGDNNYLGIYRSDDGGESWSITSPPVGGPYTDSHPNLATLSNTNTLQQGFYNLGIAASHTNADEVLIGCLNLWRTRDGGVNFEPLGGYQGNVPYIHPDQQEIEILGNDMWTASDGGINYSTDLFSSHESRKRGLNASEFWGFDTAWNTDLVVGGRYHNGNSAHRPSFGVGEFLRLGGAEAPTGYIQPDEKSTAYFSDISAQEIPSNLDDPILSVPRFTMFPSETFFASHSSELEFDRDYYNHIWIGRENKLYRSEDNGNNFAVIGEFGQPDQPIMQFELRGENNEIIYAYQRTSFLGAVLWLSIDAGATWVEKSFPSGVPSMRAGAITAHDENPGTLWVSFAHQNNDGAKLYRTDDFGDSWQNITEEILDGETIHSIVHQQGTDNELYIGTNFGVYHHDGTSISPCSEGLPMRIPTNKLVPYYANNKIRMGSYSNGIWEADLISPSRLTAKAMVDKAASQCARDTFYFSSRSIAYDNGSLSYNWTFDPAPAYISDASAKEPKVVFGDIGQYDVSLTISNGQVSDEYTKESMVTILEDQCRPDLFPSLAAEMHGTGVDYIQLRDTDEVLSAFTMTAWVRPDGIQNDFSGIYFNDDASVGLNFFSDNQLGFHHPSAGSTAWAWPSGLIVADGAWSHVAMTVDAEGATLYVNGIPARREFDADPVVFGTMKIGSYKGWGSRNFSGEIDEVTLWNRALSLEEIRNQRHITKNIDNAPGLIAYYQFNDDSNVVLDLIDINHGIVNGTTSLINSSAPVGDGIAISSNDAGNQIHSFTGTQIEVNATLEASSMLTVSEINIAPENLNITDPILNNKFWILNGYGDIEMNGFKINDLDLDPLGISIPEQLELYSRSENESLADWDNQGNPVSLTQNPNTIEFGNTNLLSRQFTLGTNNVTSTNDPIKDQANLFPNPAHSQITISNLPDLSVFTIYSVKGQVIYKKEILANERLELLPELPDGTYPYTIEMRDSLKTGKLIIVKK